MRIGIYIDPVSATAPPGGAAYSACVLAEHLERHHDVELVHHRANFTRTLLNHTSGLQMERTSLRYCAPVAPLLHAGSRLPWRRYRAQREWRSELCKGYDVFVAFVHRPPPFCHARRGIVIILFPNFTRPQTNGSFLKGTLGEAYSRFEWRRRFESYEHRLAISEFAAEWTRKRWNVSCGIAHPPVNLVAPADKEDLILSVGRFTPPKKQPEMVAAFRDLATSLPAGWSMACAGGCDQSPATAEYFGRAQAAAGAANVRFHLNLSRDELDGLYGRAKIFWHAMGYLSDIAQAPERMEHFGIVTVEAMSAGCVPVVFDGGGQTEIVRHGVDGFRWKTIEELHAYTRQLAADDNLRAAMSRSAVARATQFDRTHYLDAMTRLIERD
jgi:L-malate glycosyltransferase